MYLTWFCLCNIIILLGTIILLLFNYVQSVNIYSFFMLCIRKHGIQRLPTTKEFLFLSIFNDKITHKKYVFTQISKSVYSLTIVSV